MSSPEHECSVHGLTEYLPPDANGNAYCKKCIYDALEKMPSRSCTSLFLKGPAAGRNETMCAILPGSGPSKGVSIGGAMRLADGKIIPLEEWDFFLDGPAKKP